MNSCARSGDSRKCGHSCEHSEWWFGLQNSVFFGPNRAAGIPPRVVLASEQPREKLAQNKGLGTEALVQRLWVKLSMQRTCITVLVVA